MACEFDREIFESFRARAITDVNKLEIGKEYFSNSHPERFVVKEIISEIEHSRRHEFEVTEHDSADPHWVVYGESVWDAISLSDRNVISSYNPWMIFADEATMNECCEKLIVTITSDDSYDNDYYDGDYGYDGSDDYIENIDEHEVA